MKTHDFRGFLFTQIGMYNLEPGRYLRETAPFQYTPQNQEEKFSSSNHQLIIQVIFFPKILGSCRGEHRWSSLPDAFLFIPLHQHPALAAEATEAAPKGCWKRRKRHQTPHGVLEIHNPQKLLPDVGSWPCGFESSSLFIDAYGSS